MDTKKLITAFAAGTFLLALSSSVSVISAQEKKATPDVSVEKSGQIHLNVKAKAGSVMLEPGMYQIQHAVEGTQHFVTFKAVQMPAGYRHSNTPVAKEASARVPCKVEPLDKKATKTTITLRTNAAGEKEVAEVMIAGESFKHVF